jgi:hypothetical protein
MNLMTLNNSKVDLVKKQKKEMMELEDKINKIANELEANINKLFPNVQINITHGITFIDVAIGNQIIFEHYEDKHDTYEEELYVTKEIREKIINLYKEAYGIKDSVQ